MQIVELKEKRRDELFETVAEVCGIDIRQLTKSARGQLNKACSELRELNPQADEIRKRADCYRERYEGIPLTPTAFVKHWPALNGNAPKKQQSKDYDWNRRGKELGIHPKPGESQFDYTRRVMEANR